MLDKIPLFQFQDVKRYKIVDLGLRNDRRRNF